MIQKKRPKRKMVRMYRTRDPEQRTGTKVCFYSSAENGSSV